VQQNNQSGHIPGFEYSVTLSIDELHNQDAKQIVVAQIFRFFGATIWGRQHNKSRRLVACDCGE
jgi:hypothetical protein